MRLYIVYSPIYKHVYTCTYSIERQTTYNVHVHYIYINGSL